MFKLLDASGWGSRWLNGGGFVDRGRISSWFAESRCVLWRGGLEGTSSVRGVCKFRRSFWVACLMDNHS